MKALLLHLFFLSAFFSCIAQSEHRWCGTDERLKQQIAEQPSLKAGYDLFLSRLADFQQQYSSRAEVPYSGGNPSDASAVVYIPVVFHIVHNGDAIGTGENITDAQILSQIDALNRDFNAQDPDAVNIPAAFQSLQANCNIIFCLAKFDPDGNPTTGIIRHQLSNATWDTETDIDNNLKPSTIWDRNRYLNIWSIRMGGSLSTNGVLAYSSFPFFGNANADGVVARFNTIGTTGSLMPGYNRGKTITHEVGHWLGLLHTWGTGAGCGDQGDFVADTPDQDDANFSCPNFPLVSCPSAAPNGDMFMNYMDYTSDACRNMFSKGQLSNMLSVINGFRTSLKNAATQCYYNLDVAAKKLLLPTDTICSLSFQPSFMLKNEGITTVSSVTVYYEIDNNGVQLFTWNGSLAMQEETNVFLPVITLPEGNYMLYITIANPNGQADGLTTNNELTKSFYVYGGASAATVPFTENFESGFPSAGWEVVNPNNDVTWGLDSYSAYGNGFGCVSIDNFSYGANPNKKKDAFVSPPFDLSGTQYPELKFDVAYARRDNSKFDSLNLYYSLNCGSTWTKIWNQRGTELATAPDASTLYYPGNSEWKTVTLPLVQLGGFSRVSFKWENVTGWGNVLYLDNINLQNNSALTATNVVVPTFTIYPNPAQEVCHLELPAHHTYSTIVVLNTLGEVVCQHSIYQLNTAISTSTLPNGLYYICLQGKTRSEVQKMIVTH